MMDITDVNFDEIISSLPDIYKVFTLSRLKHLVYKIIHKPREDQPITNLIMGRLKTTMGRHESMTFDNITKALSKIDPLTNQVVDCLIDFKLVTSRKTIIRGLVLYQVDSNVAWDAKHHNILTS